MRTCDICRERPAKFVCQRCGALVCELDFDLPSGLCINCRRLADRMEVQQRTSLSNLPFLVLLIGIALIFIGFIVIASSAIIYPAHVSGGGIFLIGPIPIIVGFGEHAWPIMLILAIIAIILILLQLLVVKKSS